MRTEEDHDGPRASYTSAPAMPFPTWLPTLGRKLGWGVADGDSMCEKRLGTPLAQAGTSVRSWYLARQTVQTRGVGPDARVQIHPLRVKAEVETHQKPRHFVPLSRHTPTQRRLR